MFTKPSSHINNKAYLMTRYFEGTDVLNSLLFKELPKLSVMTTYRVSAKRYDLISKDLYGTDNWDWMLAIYNGIQESDLIPGSEINCPNLEDVNQLIMKMK